MSIAGAWRKEKGQGQDSLPKRRLMYPASAADRISVKVIEISPEDDVDGAMRALARGVRRRVTFRRAVVVSCVPPPNFNEPMGNLPRVGVPAGQRGTATAVVVDGRAVVTLDDKRMVLARVGEDCRLLGRWFRFVDWLRRRRFE